MAIRRNPKDYIASYELRTDWEEVLAGDESLFNDMTEKCIPALLQAARRAIDWERRLGNLQPNLLQPVELVGETLIEAWQARHGRNIRRPLIDWLLEVQRHALRRLIQEEKELHDPIAITLEECVPAEPAEDEETALLEAVEQPIPIRWEDVIPDGHAQEMAA